MPIYINNEKMRPMSYMEPDIDLDDEDYLLPVPDPSYLAPKEDTAEETMSDTPDSP